MKIGLIVNKDKENATLIAQKIVDLLHDEDVIILSSFSIELTNTQKYNTDEDIIKNCDVAITVGGDGTIIHSAKFAGIYKKPLIGVNLGRIGFVAGVEPDEISSLKKLVTGDYKIQTRMLLDVVVNHNGEQYGFTAVNEAAICRSALSSIVDIFVSLNNERIISYRADGMLFATPTGSTAYSFSAGGPVVEPDMKCILLTPVCPHALSSRQVVFSENSELTAQVLLPSNSKCYLTVDGQNSIELNNLDTVCVKKSELELNVIILKEKNFYTLLNEKLKERDA